jgi:hypothetical protein
MIWTRQDHVTIARSADDDNSGCERIVLGYGGAIEECGALRLTEADGDGDESEIRNCPIPGSSEDAVAKYADATDPPILKDHCRPSLISARSPTLFDADFDVKLDAETGRWVVSNVNVIKRS